MSPASHLAVVVTTYNRPKALAWVLAGLAAQTHPAAVVVVADDGSGHETQQLMTDWQHHWPVPQTTLRHVWQADEGFRAARVRNLGVARAVQLARAAGKTLSRIVFLDGDCIPPPHFLTRHAALGGDQDQHRVIAGGRALLTPAYTQALESAAPLPNVEAWSDALRPFRDPLSLWLKGHSDRWLPMLNLPDGQGWSWRRRRPKAVELVRTCNLSVSASAFERVNGFDESFVGWGLEDTELAVRLVLAGERICSGRMATNVYHLWHPESDRSALPEHQRKLNELVAQLSVPFEN